MLSFFIIFVLLTLSPRKKVQSASTNPNSIAAQPVVSIIQASMAQAPPKMQPATPMPQMISESTVGVIL
jgi:hypothetical protein